MGRWLLHEGSITFSPHCMALRAFTVMSDETPSFVCFSWIQCYYLSLHGWQNTKALCAFHLNPPCAMNRIAITVYSFYSFFTLSHERQEAQFLRHTQQGAGSAQNNQ